MKYKLMPNGYQILDNENNIVYIAGNHPRDSQVFLKPDDPKAVSQEKLKQYALRTLDEWEG